MSNPKIKFAFNGAVYIWCCRALHISHTCIHCHQAFPKELIRKRLFIRKMNNL